MFNVLSLCSGIGGLDLAAKAHRGATVCYVEIDPFCQAVLGARMREGEETQELVAGVMSGR